jgi:hypothetical protein
VEIFKSKLKRAQGKEMIDEKNKRRNEVNFFYNGIDYQEAIELLEGVEQK